VMKINNETTAVKFDNVTNKIIADGKCLSDLVPVNAGNEG